MEARTWLPLLLPASSIALYLLVLVVFLREMRRHRRAPKIELDRAPLVTILKPLAGADDELDLNLESFATIDYPAFEIVFGVASLDDAALPAARRFLARHPKIAARIVLTDPDAALNPKVAQLVALDRVARGEVVVISDSNVRVAKTYLWSVVRELAMPRAGLVTHVFAGRGERSFGAALENLQLGAMVVPGVVAAGALVGRALTVGKSMGMRRRDLVLLGGFARFGDVLAEDHALGVAFGEAGFGIRTSLDVIVNANVSCGIERTMERHTRWAKLRRVIAPGAFALEPFFSPLLVATIVALATRTTAAFVVVVLAACVQIAGSAIAVRRLRGRAFGLLHAPLEVLRTWVLFVCWLRACASVEVCWRGHRFQLRRGSQLVPVVSSAGLKLRGETPA